MNGTARGRGVDVLVATAGVALLVLAAEFRPDAAEQARGLLLPALALAAALTALNVALRPGNVDRTAWLLVTAGCSWWTVGEVVVSAYRLAGIGPPAGGVREVAELAALVPFTVAFLALAPGVRIASRIADLLDGLLIAAALLFLSWSFVLAPLQAAAHATGVIDVAQPLGHFLLVSMALFVTTRSRPAERGTIGLLAAAVVALAAADTGSTWLRVSGDGLEPWVMETARIAGYACAVLAGLRTGIDETEDEARPSLRRVALPYAPALVVAFTALAKVNWGNGLAGFLTLNLAAVAVLFIVRQSVLLVEHLRLSVELHDRVEERTAELVAHEHRFRALVQKSSDVTTLVSAAGRILYQSDAAHHVFGYSPGSLVGTPFVDWVHEADKERMASLLADLLEFGGETSRVAVRLQRADRQWASAEIDLADLRTEPAVGALVLNVRDVTDRHVLQRRLHHHATYDQLTGLANRAHFTTALRAAIVQHLSPALVLIDLDRFGDVNTRHGQAAGDRVLQETASRLRATVRSTDLVARFGADEFAVLVLPGDDGTTDHGPVIARLTAALGPPVTLSDGLVELTFSAGVALAQPGDDPDVVVGEARVALAAARNAGRGGRVVYDEQLAGSELERLRLGSELHDAITSGGLSLVYQPSVRLADSQMVGVEAAVQWDHPRHGVIGAEAILDLAEAEGEGDRLASWMVEECCRIAASWTPSPERRTVSIGMSSGHLRRLPNTIAGAIEAAGLPRGAVVVEVSGRMTAGGRASRAIADLRRRGVVVGIADAAAGLLIDGDGMAVVDAVLLDTGLVERIDADDRAVRMVEAVIELAHAAGVPAIARGVDREAQVVALRQAGCDQARGRCFGRPMSQGRLESALGLVPSAGVGRTL